MAGRLKYSMIAVLLTSAAIADDRRPNIHSPADIVWLDGPKSLPAGAKVAMLEGDPGNSGPFVMRVKLPDGYKIAPHKHPKPERLTVISGRFHLGMGDRFDAKHATPMAAGTFGVWPAGMTHFAWTEGETIVQIHGDGPWSIEYVNAADDPRNSK